MSKFYGIFAFYCVDDRISDECLRKQRSLWPPVPYSGRSNILVELSGVTTDSGRYSFRSHGITLEGLGIFRQQIQVNNKNINVKLHQLASASKHLKRKSTEKHYDFVSLKRNGASLMCYLKLSLKFVAVVIYVRHF